MHQTSGRVRSGRAVIGLLGPLPVVGAVALGWIAIGQLARTDIAGQRKIWRPALVCAAGALLLVFVEVGRLNRRLPR